MQGSEAPYELGWVCVVWFKHILFMMKRIGRGLNATRALFWKEYLQGNSLTHTVIQQHEHIIKIHNIKTCD